MRRLVRAIDLLLVVATMSAADDPAERPAAALEAVNADRAAHELARCPSTGR